MNMHTLTHYTSTPEMGSGKQVCFPVNWVVVPLRGLIWMQFWSTYEFSPMKGLPKIAKSLYGIWNLEWLWVGKSLQFWLNLLGPKVPVINIKKEEDTASRCLLGAVWCRTHFGDRVVECCDWDSSKQLMTWLYLFIFWIRWYLYILHFFLQKITKQRKYSTVEWNNQVSSITYTNMEALRQYTMRN